MEAVTSGTDWTPHEGWAAINQRAGEQGAILKPRRRFGKRSGDMTIIVHT